MITTEQIIVQSLLLSSHHQLFLDVEGENHKEALSDSCNKTEENKDDQAVENLNIISSWNVRQ